jgi:hypothetical protein
MNKVTGPISISMGSWRRRRSPGTSGAGEPNGAAGANLGAGTNGVANASTNSPAGSAAALPGEAAEEEAPIIRNIVFSSIRATVVKPFPLPECEWPSGYNPGEVFSCIGLNAIDGNVIENIVFDNVHITFPGGGTAEQAAVRDVPRVVGEYYAVGIFPSYALYARNVRGLTLHNVRFDLAAPDLRPAVVFDHVRDAAVTGLNVQGVKDAESALRFIGSQDVLLSAPRLLSPAPVFLQVEGADNENIILDGGDISKAAEPVAFKNGAKAEAVKLHT